MARVNKMLSGVFSKIIGGENKMASYDAFLNSSKLKSSSSDFKRYVEQYREAIDKERKKFEYFSTLEKVIMQQASMDNMSQIKIFKIREYLYARCPFYRDDVVTKDVRVIVDNAEFWPQAISKLEADEKFMKKAKDKLRKQMNEILQDSIEKLLRIEFEQNKKPSAKKTTEKKPAAKKVAKPKIMVVEETV